MNALSIPKPLWVWGGNVLEDLFPLAWLCSHMIYWHQPKWGATGRAFSQQDTVHVIWWALPGIRLSPLLQGPSQQQEIGCHGRVAPPAARSRRWDEWWRPLSHGRGAGGGEKPWPPGSSGRSEPACRWRAGRKEKLPGTEETNVTVPSFTSDISRLSVQDFLKHILMCNFICSFSPSQ